MSGRVKRHCNIRNYLKKADPVLLEIIDDLCVGRMLVPRKGSPGITFLRPDKALLAKIAKMAESDTPEDAVAALQSCVIKDFLPNPKDFAEKKSDIPTYLNKKLPVESSDGKKVLLGNKATLVRDDDFKARADRANIAVYVLSGDLIPTNTAAATFENVKAGKKKVKGGGDTSGVRGEVFERVLEQACNKDIYKNRDPAMEVLVSVCDFLQEQKKQDEYDAVASQLSWDTLASLAIVLRPYASENPGLYFSSYDDWSKEENRPHEAVYSMCPDIVGKYAEHMNRGATACEKAHEAIKTARENANSNFSKATVVRVMAEAFGVAAASGLPARRQRGVGNVKIAAAEAELRLVSSILQSDARGPPNFEQAKGIFCSDYTLDAPWTIGKQAILNRASVAYLYSSVFALIRSDSLVYIPGNSGNVSVHTDSIKDATARLRFDEELEASKRALSAAYNNRMQAVMARWAGDKDWGKQAAGKSDE